MKEFSTFARHSDKVANSLNYSLRYLTSNQEN